MTDLRGECRGQAATAWLQYRKHPYKGQIASISHLHVMMQRYQLNLHGFKMKCAGMCSSCNPFARMGSSLLQRWRPRGAICMTQSQGANPQPAQFGSHAVCQSVRVGSLAIGEDEAAGA